MAVMMYAMPADAAPLHVAYQLWNVPALIAGPPATTDQLGMLLRSEVARWRDALTRREFASGLSSDLTGHPGTDQGPGSGAGPNRGTVVGRVPGLRTGGETYKEVQATRPVDKIIGRLRTYKALGENWNGYGGKAPPHKAVEQCVGFLRSLGELKTFPKPMVGGNGEVGLFWETPDVFVEVGFRGDDGLGYLVEFADGRSEEAEGVPLGEPEGLLAEGLASFRGV